MTQYLLKCALLIGQSPDDYRVWGRFDDQPTTSGIPQWMIVLGCTALVLAVIGLVNGILARRRRREFWRDNSAQLFQDLCRSHRLALSHRRLLKKLAASRGISHPADLFIEPRHFETADLPSGLQSSARELRQLRHTLFD